MSDLLESQVAADPISQFTQWFEEALSANVTEPNAMTLSTVSADNKPSSRIVLLKDVAPAGFSFFTNYHSRKGAELLGNPHACLLFFWPDLQRQVRIEGAVSVLPEAVSTAYFQTRPRGSRIGAVASPQSERIESRERLDERIRAVEDQYAGQEEIPRPAHWGGYQLQPDRVEFWQGRGSRLHDRLCYQKTESGWELIRLAP
jgi:pyridoxamine 5'-phosphate oxidase